MHIVFFTFFFFKKREIKMRMLITKTLKVAAKGVNLRVLTVDTLMVQRLCIYLTEKKIKLLKKQSTMIGGV